MRFDDRDVLASQLVSVFELHPEILTVERAQTDEDRLELDVSINVELPLAAKDSGQSANGVFTTEYVTVKIPDDFPWSSPRFYLRQDFPRELPHLQPGSKNTRPRPCLVNSFQDEFFRQFDLPETGILFLIDQLVEWLQRAAVGDLQDPAQGWEPMLRNGLSSFVTIDADFSRSLIRSQGGSAILPARYFGECTNVVGDKSWFLINARPERVTIKKTINDTFTGKVAGEYAAGNTIVALLYPGKEPSGQKRKEAAFFPEDVETFVDLKERARRLGCEKQLSSVVQRIRNFFDGSYLNYRIPVTFVFCVRRPFMLEGQNSDIELLPYVVEIFPVENRKRLFENGSAQPVLAAAQIDSISRSLLQNVSGSPELPRTAIVGCGSIGSKVALHLAKSGAEVVAISDSGYLRPHNMARHGLVRGDDAGLKVSELSDELVHLAQSPTTYSEDLITGLGTKHSRKLIVPSKANLLINTTASLGVRESLCKNAARFEKTRLSEMALFGRGEASMLMIEGLHGNPNLCDLTAFLYAQSLNNRSFELLHDDQYGLTEVQIGQGCSSLTMPMTDMRISSATASMTEDLLKRIEDQQDQGSLVLGVRSAEADLNCSWTVWDVEPFVSVPVEGSDGWTLRISQPALTRMHEDIAKYPSVETGGVLIGTCSARLKTTTVVDVLDAPRDSIRSATRFVLGKKGLKKAIGNRFNSSGEKLLDLGTWHSHLAEVGPSDLDWSTAQDLAEGRPPPSVLLILTPQQQYAISKSI